MSSFNSSRKRKETKKSLPILIHLLLISLAVVSAFFTSQGYINTGIFGNDYVAYAVSIIVASLMFIFLEYIAAERFEGHSTKGIVVLYIVCAVVCIIGSSAKFYDNSNKESVFRNELLAKQVVLSDLVESTNKLLLKPDPEKEKKIAEVESLKQQLYLQITDPARPGMGKRAREIKAQLEAKLGQKFTDFGGTPTEVAQKLDEIISKAILAKYHTKEEAEAIALAKENIKIKEEVDRKVNEVLANAAKDDKVLFQANVEITQIINNMGLKIEKQINNLAIYDFKEVEFENIDIGGYAYLLKMFQSSAIIGPLLISIFIDFIGLLAVIFIAKKPEVQTRRAFNNAR